MTDAMLRQHPIEASTQKEVLTMTSKNTGNIMTESDTVSRATTPGRIAKFANAGTLTDSIITEDAGRIGVGTAPSTAILTVTSAAAASPAISARNTATGGIGVSGDSPSGNAVLGVSQSGNGVLGKSFDGLGVAGQSTSFDGVFGTSSSGNGVLGVSRDGVVVEDVKGSGVLGVSSSGVGVLGQSTTGPGVAGISAQNDGVQCVSKANGKAAVAAVFQGINGYGIYAQAAAPSFAGNFVGNVRVFGTISRAGGGFLIDHPLDPTHKTLTHSFVESPDMMNLYNGTTITDAQGDATITLPAYFQALNHEFRYQLTVLEQFAQAIVSREIQENAFTIKTDKPHVKVSWQVTGVRQDAYANAHRLAVEADKPAQEQGMYLYPEEHGQPKTKGMAQPRQLGEIPPMNADEARQRVSTQS
jgi:hypothetical protein